VRDPVTGSVGEETKRLAGLWGQPKCVLKGLTPAGTRGGVGRLLPVPRNGDKMRFKRNVAMGARSIGARGGKGETV